MKDAPSLVDVKETGDNKSPHPTPTKPDRDEKKFQLSVKETSLTPEFLNLKQLISRHGTSFDQRRRMELAFRLSSAVLLLWSSPWIANSSRWKDWAVWFDPQNKEPLFNLYFSRKPQSDNGSPDQKSSAGAAFFILSREPVLSLLGLRLIEIAFGRTLADVRQEDVTLLSKEGDQDQDSMDLFTAKRLLALRRIGQTFGQEFEDVVNVCLNQQYRERKGARITELDFEDRSFLERAAVSILLPLYQEARKNSGYVPGP